MEHWNIKDKLLLALIPRCSSVVLRILNWTLRKEFRKEEYPQEFWDQGRQIIVAFWHQRLLMMPFLRVKGKFGMMISQHRDGEFIARTIKRFGIESVRGSTTRGGLSALRGMIRFFHGGASLAITPDGPQGPKHVVQTGVVELARQTGAPILPVTYGASRKKIFNSWDNFIFPLPFGTVVYIWGEPLRVPPDLNKDEMEQFRLLLQNRLHQITGEADRIFQPKR